jgi:hypothetical protein
VVGLSGATVLTTITTMSEDEMKRSWFGTWYTENLLETLSRLGLDE